MEALNDVDCQNALATVVLSLQALTSEQSVKEPWRLLPPASALIERIGAVRESQVYVLSQEDTSDLLERISCIVKLQTLEPSVVMALGKLAEKLSATQTKGEAEDPRPQTSQSAE